MAITEGTNAGFVTSRPSEDPEGSSTSIDNRAWATKSTSPATAAKVTEIGFWVVTGYMFDKECTVGIYTDNAVDEEPEELVGSVTLQSGSEEKTWLYQSCDISIDSNTDYWIAAQMDDSPSSTYTDYSTTGGEGGAYLGSQTTLPDPWETTAKGSEWIVSIYAVWEAGAAAPTTSINIGDSWKTISGANVMKINIGDAWKNVAAAKINIGDAWKAIPHIA